VVQRPQDQPAVRAPGVLGQHPRLAGESIAERSAVHSSIGRRGARHIHRLFIYYMN
jgi:hypothetical protein